jgi:twitching motility protein PilT
MSPSFHAQENSHAAMLSDLPFTELYIRVDDPSFGSRYKPDVTRTGRATLISANLAVPDKFFDAIGEIRVQLLPFVKEKEIGVIMYRDLRLRYTISEAADGEVWAALRPIPLIVPTPDELLIDPEFVEAMMIEARKKGLILIGGKTGQGKTTTAAAFLRNFCVYMGGTLFTMEDPVEYMLSGALSEHSWCFQHEIHTESDWEKIDKKAKRFNPDWMFFGEIRSMEAAEQLVAAAGRGQLVVATIHSSSIADTVNSLLQYLKPEMRESARRSLASNIRMIVHQTMTPRGPYLERVTMTNEVNDPIRNALEEGNLQNLGNSLKRHQPAKPAPTEEQQKQTRR